MHDRRTFLTGATLTALLPVRDALADNGVLAPNAGWDDVRAQFALSDDLIHMSALLLASNPASVRAAIERHRRALDADPVGYLNQNGNRLLEEARAAAGRYLEVPGSAIALTDSTTMGIGLVYNGLRLKPGDEVLTTEHDFYATHEALRLAAQRTGAQVRRVALFEQPQEASEDEIVARLARAITPATRVLALTWVHSATGLKLPLRRIADAVEKINAARDEQTRVLICVDGVHGFGNQDARLADLGCDLFMAGCHKWLFGPRGTGLIAGTERGWQALRPIIPSFADGRSWTGWMNGHDPIGPTDATRMMPGGFKPFEHQWALSEAFAFHDTIGKARVARRTAELAAQLKEGLAAIPRVTVYTPRAPQLSGGLVCFDVEGFTPPALVKRLRERRVVATTTPYARSHARLTPSIINTPAEIETALREIRALAG